MPKGNGGKTPVIPGERPQPPAELTQEEAREWTAIVGRMPQDWFPAETWPVLVAKLRITPQARYAQSEARHRDKMPSVKPWAFTGGKYDDIRRSPAWGDPSAAAAGDDDEAVPHREVSSNRGD
jgi:hypothetical protein